MGGASELGRESWGDNVKEGDDEMSDAVEVGREFDMGIEGWMSLRGEVGGELSRPIVIRQDRGKIGEERILERAGRAELWGVSNAGQGEAVRSFDGDWVS